VIVLLVVHLTKIGTNSSAGGTSTPSTSTSPAAASRYVFTEASRAGSYELNSAATRALRQDVKGPAAEIRADGAGSPGKEAVAVYNLSSVTDPSASDFKAAEFIGYEGTFNPSKVIKYEQTQLVSTRMVNPGPHGGEMMCGYNRSAGSDASECLWVTKSTFGRVEFTSGGVPVKYQGASGIALDIRQAVEVPAS